MAPDDDQLFEFEPYDHAEPEQTNADTDDVEPVRDDSIQQGESEWTSDDELHDEFRAEPIPVVNDPQDGLPRPVDLPPGYGPPLTIGTVVCIEDERQYLELFYEELVARGYEFASGNVGADGIPLEGETSKWRLPGQARSVDLLVRSRYDAQGQEQERRRYEPATIKHHWGHVFYRNEEDHLVPVRPRRERCQHYKRMVFANKTIPDPRVFGHRLYYRNCTVRRSLGGAFMSLQNEGVYACDFRDPPDPGSVDRHLDTPDRQRIADKLHLKLSPAMGMPGDDIQLTEADTGYDTFDDFRQEKGIFT